MNRKLLFGALVFSLASVSGCGDSESTSDPAPESAAAAPVEKAAVDPNAYAAPLDTPRRLPDDPSAQMIVMMLESSDVPSAAEVGLPQYPGARLMSAMQGMQMTSNGETMTSWPSLAMLSEDEIGAVAAFYQKELANWRHSEIVGTHSFWNGDEDSNPLDITGQFSLVALTPVEESDTIRMMWPEARTRIDVRYEP